MQLQNTHFLWGLAELLLFVWVINAEEAYTLCATGVATIGKHI